MNPPRTHKCATVGCIRVIPDHLLMCSGHWAELPSYQKARVYHLWNNVKKNQPGARREHAVYVTQVKAEQGVRLGRLRCIESGCEKKAAIVLDMEPLCQAHAQQKAGLNK